MLALLNSDNDSAYAVASAVPVPVFDAHCGALALLVGVNGKVLRDAKCCCDCFAIFFCYAIYHV